MVWDCDWGRGGGWGWGWDWVDWVVWDWGEGWVGRGWVRDRVWDKTF